MQENIFSQSTRLFNIGKYEQGLEKISSCILASPNNSMLYSNRALFYYQLKSNDKAIHDLTTAVNINYLNHIAYFNLFSIQLRAGGLEKQAFEDLCCSLSVLYFLRGKQLKTQIDVQKSLKYCQNNIQAHILKAMMHLQNNKLKLAANQVQWALQYSPDNIVLKKLRYYLHEKIGYKSQDDDYQTNPFQSTQKYQPQTNYRLECSLEIDNSTNIEKEIQTRLLQFTQIYNDLNSIYGTVTQRIIIGNDEILNVEKSLLNNVSGIWDNGKKSQIFIQRESPKIEQTLNRQQNLQCQFKSQQAQSNFLSQPEISQQQQPLTQQYGQQHGEQVDNCQDYLQPQQNQINQDDGQQSKSQNDVQQSNTDFFIANERQQVYQQEDFLVDQSNYQNRSCEVFNTGFTKLDSKKSYHNSQNKNKQDKMQENMIEQQNLINQMEFQVPLPVPLNPENSNFIEYVHNNENQNQQKEQQPQHLTTQQDYLTSPDDKNHVPSYGEILTQQNQNIEFHESQVIQPQSQTNQQQNQIVQNTLINDLMSETSRKSHQSFNSFTDLENKNLIQQRLKQIKQKVAKNLDNSAKRLMQKQSFENDIRSSQKLTQKSSQKIESIPLYPYSLPKKQIFFTFNSIQFLKKYKFAQLNEVYFVAVYHLSIPKYKMKSQSRKLQGTICNWNQKFAQVNLLEQQKSLKITVFNKGKGTKARDEPLGQGEKEILQTGSVRLGIYDKKTLIGYVKFIINLI